MSAFLDRIDPSAAPLHATALKLLEPSLVARALAVACRRPPGGRVAVLGLPDCPLVAALLAHGEERGWTMERWSRGGEGYSGAFYVTPWGRSFDWAHGDSSELLESLSEDFAAVQALCQGLQGQGEPDRPFLLGLGRGECPEHAFLPAALQCLALERPGFTVNGVLSHDSPDPGDLATRLFELARVERGERFEGTIHLRGCESYVRDWDDLAETGACPSEAGACPSEGEPGLLRTVVVFGGARGILPCMLTELARRSPVRFVVTGRSPIETEVHGEEELDEPETLRARLRSAEPEVSAREIRRRVGEALRNRERRRNLARLAEVARVEYRICDVSDPRALSEVLDSVEREFGGIDGIIHGAGVTCDKSLKAHDRPDLERVLAPKVVPLAVMARRSWRRSPAFIVGLSSLAAVTGNLRQSSYGGANAVLEAVLMDEGATIWPKDCKRRILSFAAWSGGMVGPGLEGILASLGIPCIPLALGGPTLADGLASPERVSHRLVLPEAPYFVQALEAHREGPRRAARLSDGEVPLRIVHEEASLLRYERGLDEGSRVKLGDHCLCECAPLIPGSMLLALVVEDARRWCGATGRLDLLLHRALRFFPGPDSLRPLELEFRLENDELAYAVRSAGGGRCEGRLRWVRDAAIDDRVLPDLMSLRWQDLPPERIYGGGGNELGPAYQILGTVAGIFADGIEAELTLPTNAGALEGLLELITQLNSTYCIAHHGAVSYPYRYENFSLGDLPEPGSPLSIRMRRRLPTEAGGLCAMDVEVRGEGGRVLARGGPLVNLTMGFGDELHPGPGSCRFMDRAGMERVDAFLGEQALDLDQAYLSSEEEKSLVALLPPGGRAAHMAAKSAIVNLARSLGRGVSVPSFLLRSEVTGEGLHASWPPELRLDDVPRDLHLACCEGGGVGWVTAAGRVAALALRPIGREADAPSRGVALESELVLGRAWSKALHEGVADLMGPIAGRPDDADPASEGEASFVLGAHHGQQGRWAESRSGHEGGYLRIRAFSGSYLMVWRDGDA